MSGSHMMVGKHTGSMASMTSPGLMTSPAVSMERLAETRRPLVDVEGGGFSWDWASDTPDLSDVNINIQAGRLSAHSHLYIG